jgi:hypothetical protein
MGKASARGEDLLNLYGQWELEWLKRESQLETIPIKDNARGETHAPPHLPWRVWSVTLDSPLPIGSKPTKHIIVATVAIDNRVLSLRALLPNQERALWALRRLVFAVDSLEVRPEPIKREQFVTALRAQAQKDPTCSNLHDTYGEELSSGLGAP